MKKKEMRERIKSLESEVYALRARLGAATGPWSRIFADVEYTIYDPQMIADPTIEKLYAAGVDNWEGYKVAQED